MTVPDNPEAEKDTRERFETDLVESIEASQRLQEELSFLFGEEIVGQAQQIDIAELNLNKEIIDCISTGVRQLKALKSNPAAQLELINTMAPGARIVLCLWVMDMDLLEKIQNGPYIKRP